MGVSRPKGVPLGVWLAYTPGGSASEAVPFDSEVFALRYAVSEGGMKVVALRRGVQLSDLMRGDEQTPSSGVHSE